MLSEFSVELEAFYTADLRPTAQRYAVLECLTGGSIHATAEEIFSAVNRDDTCATVYDNLQSLTLEDIPRFDLPAPASQPELRGGEVHNYEIGFHGTCADCGKAARA